MPVYDYGSGKAKEDPDLYRILAVPSTLSLWHLAELIVQAFEFDFDHMFGLFDNIYHPWKSKIEYSEKLQSVSVEALFEEKKKKWCFLYDFGDEWRFWISRVKKTKPEADAEYPKIVESKGEPPEQYPDEEGEEE